jgi:hypothetical protein
MTLTQSQQDELDYWRIKERQAIEQFKNKQIGAGVVKFKRYQNLGEPMGNGPGTAMTERPKTELATKLQDIDNNLCEISRRLEALVGPVPDEPSDRDPAAKAGSIIEHASVMLGCIGRKAVKINKCMDILENFL